jgi:Zn-dependent protease
MSPAPKGSVRLFRVVGIDVFLHWSWLIVAFYQIGERQGEYSSLAWNTAEYLTLFLIVLLHEFGHALACRQVGGRAEQIMLWPLGGVAYIAPPQRPGAMLWSIAAGPLVNVALILPLAGLSLFSRAQDWAETMPDASHLVWMITFINIVLLIFNLLPVYPLDGGQILRSLLWFFVGRARSLSIVAVIGFFGVAALAAYAWHERSIWMGIMTYFVFQRCLSGWRQAQSLGTLARLPRRAGFSCPSCHASPQRGPMWLCPQCRAQFDPFETQAECPHCHAQFPTSQCLDCGVAHSMSEWSAPADGLAPHAS